MIYKLIFGLLISLASMSLIAQTASIDVIAMPTEGDPVKVGTVEVINPITGESLGKRNKAAPFRIEGLPYGEFELRVEVPAFKNHRRRIRVFQPHVYLLVGLIFSHNIDRSPRRLSGVIRNISGQEGTFWARLTPLLSSSPSLDSSVGTDGRFELVGLDACPYILLIFRGQDHLLARRVDMFESNVDIALPESVKPKLKE